MVVRPPEDTKPNSRKNQFSRPKATYPSGLVNLVEETRHPSADRSSRSGVHSEDADAASRQQHSVIEDVTSVPSKAFSVKTTATCRTSASEMKLSSERLEVLVVQLRDTNDELEAGTIILEFALRVKNHELVLSGADLSIVGAMKRFSNSSKVQTRGCKALAEMASKGLPSIESIIDKGGSEAILTAMEKHRAEEELQREACRAIEVISKNSNLGKQSFGSNAVNAIRAILNCMGDHTTSAKIQRLCCRALTGITAKHKECSETLVDVGGLATIRKTLKNHDDSPEVIENAFDILISISSAVSECALDEEIAMTISIDRIFANMLLYRHSEKMQRQGMALLGILCKSSLRNRVKVSSLYGLEMITKSLENCINNKDVLRYGCTLIQELCQTEGNAVAAGLMSEGGMELLLNIIRRHGSDDIIIQQVFLIIARMARPFSDKIRKEGGIELILTGMRRHEESISVQEAACLALWKLSSKPENANVVNSHGGVTLINGALARFPKDERISEVACEALAAISNDEEMLIANQTLKARKTAVAVNLEQAPQPGCFGCL